jgi:hypothetical protein
MPVRARISIYFDVDPDPDPIPSLIIILSILGSMLKFSGKKEKYICLELIPIWIGIHWMLIPIRQNDADPTLSGSTTLTKALAQRMEGKAKTTSRVTDTI